MMTAFHVSPSGRTEIARSVGRSEICSISTPYGGLQFGGCFTGLLHPTRSTPVLASLMLHLRRRELMSASLNRCQAAIHDPKCFNKFFHHVGRFWR